MKRPRSSAPMAAALLSTASLSLPSASASYADYNHTQPIEGGFRCTTPGAGISASSRTSTPFHLLQFCFVPDQSAYLYLHIDYGDGQTGQFGAQITKGVEYCRPKTPKPVLGNSVRHAHVEFDEVRVVQATILSSGEGCLVFEGEVSYSDDAENTIANDVNSTAAEGEGQIKWLHQDSAPPSDESSTETKIQDQQDEVTESSEEEQEYDLGFEIVPPSRIGESLGPVQAIIGLDRGDSVASGSEMSRSISSGYSFVGALAVALVALPA